MTEIYNLLVSFRSGQHHHVHGVPAGLRTHGSMKPFLCGSAHSSRRGAGTGQRGSGPTGCSVGRQPRARLVYARTSPALRQEDCLQGCADKDSFRLLSESLPNPPLLIRLIETYKSILYGLDLYAAYMAKPKGLWSQA